MIDKKFVTNFNSCVSEFFLDYFSENPNYLNSILGSIKNQNVQQAYINAANFLRTKGIDVLSNKIINFQEIMNKIIKDNELVVENNFIRQIKKEDFSRKNNDSVGVTIKLPPAENLTVANLTVAKIQEQLNNGSEPIIEKEPIVLISEEQLNITPDVIKENPSSLVAEISKELNIVKEEEKNISKKNSKKNKNNKE